MSVTTRRRFIAASAIACGSAALARSAAARDPLPLTLGIQLYSLRGFPVDQALDHAKALGLTQVEFYPDMFPITDDATAIAARQKKLAERGLVISAHGVNRFTKDAAANRKLFSFAKAVGIKNVTINEPFFQGHYPGTPIMPGVLLVEAMAQLGGLLLSNVLEHTGKIAILLSIDRVKLRKPVVPGDQVVLEAENIRATARTGHLKCRALVADKVVAEAELRFMMVDPDIE